MPTNYSNRHSRNSWRIDDDVEVFVVLSETGIDVVVVVVGEGKLLNLKNEVFWVLNVTLEGPD
jgi:hypothetical protein